MERNPSMDDVTVVKSVIANGVNSSVFKSRNVDADRVLLGHVFYADYEDVRFSELYTKKSELLHPPATFIFESSKGNFHAISPVVRSLQKIHEYKDSIPLDDDNHKDYGLKKGYWTLRMSSKGVKPEPEFMGVVNPSLDRLKYHTFSKPHLDILADYHDIELAATIREECKTVGDTFNVTKYVTHERNHEAWDM